MIKISPSILAADFSELENDCKRMIENGADMLHIDVMDGHFVPNISFGASVMKCLSKKIDTFYDVHLMISSPLKYAEDFYKAGADSITFHVECEENIMDIIALIKSFGIKAGLAVNPKTPIESIYKYLPFIDMVLVMSVEPGFGGQSFMEESLLKIKLVRDEINKFNLDIDVQVDGGIDDKTCKLATENGANVLVAGSYLFSKENVADAIATLKK